MLPEVLIHLLLLMTVFFWGMSFVFIRQALVELLPMQLTLLRFFLASTGFLIYLALAKGSRVKIERRDYLRFVALGFLGVGGYHAALNFGEQWVTAGTASLIVAINPLLIVGLSAVILKERLTVNKVLGLLVAFGGLLLVLSRTDGTASATGHPVLGAVLVFAAALFWAFYTVLAKPLFGRYPSASITAYATILGTLLLVPLTPRGLWSAAVGLSGQTWVALLFLSLLSTCIGYLCWYFAVSRWDASRVAVYVYLNPVFSVLGAAFLLEERITPLFLVGGALVVCGVALASAKLGEARPKKLVIGAGNASTDSEVLP